MNTLAEYVLQELVDVNDNESSKSCHKSF